MRALAGRTALLALGLVWLGGCSWLPWHHRHADTGADQATVIEATPSGTQSEAVTPVGAPQDDYAPLSEAEWRELLASYQTLATCEDRYMNSASLNAEGVGQRLVLLNQAGALRANALRLLDDDSALAQQWRAPDAAQSDQQAQLIAHTLTDLMGEPAPGASLGHTLARKATARFYVSKVTGPVCPVTPRYQSLMQKASA